jgi:ribosomal protein S18 acetylase RimI-like enzyme
MDLVAEATGGAPAAYVGVCWDEPNRLGIFEPVCTHPDHLRRGLARSLMQRGLALLHRRGARSVMVETGDQEAANALYDGLGFTEAYRGRGFVKQLR